MNRRGRLEILMDMLRYAKTLPKVRKSWLVFECNLNFAVIKPLLGHLLDNKLMTLSSDRWYKLTRKGLWVLDDFDYLMEQFDGGDT